jgi:hypothetical protein
MITRDFFTRDLEAPERENLTGAERVYLRCYLWLRMLIGSLALLLPIVLLVGDWRLLSGPFAARGSLSAYYHSGMRDVFVGFLFAIAAFLVTYRAFTLRIENLLTIVAGLAAIVVAVFPTDRPAEVLARSPETPLQHSLGEGLTAGIHYGGAVSLIVLLAVISVFFGIKEAKRAPSAGHRPPVFWTWFHWGCAAVIACACGYMLLANSAHVLDDRYSLLIGESVSVVAFGLSWLFKGVERDMLGDTAPEATTGEAANHAPEDGRSDPRAAALRQ